MIFFSIAKKFVLTTEESLIPYASLISAAVPGGMAEWFNATVLKTVVPQGTQGSNPCPSAICFPINIPLVGIFCYLSPKIFWLSSIFCNNAPAFLVSYSSGWRGGFAKPVGCRKMPRGFESPTHRQWIIKILQKRIFLFGGILSTRLHRFLDLIDFTGFFVYSAKPKGL